MTARRPESAHRTVRDQTGEVAAGHVHTFDHETSDGPDWRGRLTITERCACGAALGTYTDRIL